MPSGKVHVVGSVALDSIEGPAGKAGDVLGGSATYACFAASFFAPARLIACVGEDFPEIARRTLEERGLDLSGLETRGGGTFRWSGRYAPAFASRETLSLDLGVFLGFDPKLERRLPVCDTLLLGNIDPDLQLKVLDQAGKDVFVATDTMDHWIRAKPEALAEGLKRAHLFFLNDEEARLLTGEENLVLAGRRIREMGPRHVVIKKGEHGALLFGDEGIAAIPALPLGKVTDPTGAGDVFAGAVLGCLARSGGRSAEELRRAMGYATVMSSFVVEEFGLERLRGLSSDEVEARLSSLRELVRF